MSLLLSLILLILNYIHLHNLNFSHAKHPTNTCLIHNEVRNSNWVQQIVYLFFPSTPFPSSLLPSPPLYSLPLLSTPFPSSLLPSPPLYSLPLLSTPFPSSLLPSPPLHSLPLNVLPLFHTQPLHNYLTSTCTSTPPSSTTSTVPYLLLHLVEDSSCAGLLPS